MPHRQNPRTKRMVSLTTQQDMVLRYLPATREELNNTFPILSLSELSHILEALQRKGQVERYHDYYFDILPPKPRLSDVQRLITEYRARLTKLYEENPGDHKRILGSYKRLAEAAKYELHYQLLATRNEG